MPGSNLIANPLVAGAAAIGFAGKSAMNFDEGMSKVCGALERLEFREA